jgi:hypothetical protein
MDYKIGWIVVDLIVRNQIKLPLIKSALNFKAGNKSNLFLINALL